MIKHIKSRWKNVKGEKHTMKIETKYNIGDHIWVIYEARINNEYCRNMPTGEISIYDAYIDSISKYKDGLMYFCNDGNYTELHEEDIILYEETDKLVAKIKELMKSINEREKEEC